MTYINESMLQFCRSLVRTMEIEIGIEIGIDAS